MTWDQLLAKDNERDTIYRQGTFLLALCHIFTPCHLSGREMRDVKRERLTMYEVYQIKSHHMGPLSLRPFTLPFVRVYVLSHITHLASLTHSHFLIHSLPTIVHDGSVR